MKRIAILCADRLPPFLWDIHGPFDAYLDKDRLFADAVWAWTR